MSSPRVLLYDLETAPLIGTSWQIYDTNVVWRIQEWYIMCFAYKWLGERQTYVVAQTDFKGYRSGSDDDKAVVSKLHELMSLADVCVAHNGNSFDDKKSHARFAFHKLGPPSPYIKVDTKLLAKRHFGFTSNKLDDIGEYLGLGRKLHTDKELWRDCMAGEMKAWKRMKAYNKQDVILLEKVYLALRSWDTTGPNMANLSDKPDVCRFCGKNEGFWKQGVRYTKTGAYQRWQCLACGGWPSDRTPIKGKEKPNYV